MIKDEPMTINLDTMTAERRGVAEPTLQVVTLKAQYTGEGRTDEQIRQSQTTPYALAVLRIPGHNYWSQRGQQGYAKQQTVVYDVSQLALDVAPGLTRRRLSGRATELVRWEGK